MKWDEVRSDLEQIVREERDEADAAVLDRLLDRLAEAAAEWQGRNWAGVKFILRTKAGAE